MDCAILFPINAPITHVDGKELVSIVINDAFPFLLKEIIMMNENCNPKCDFRHQEEWSTEAIKVSTKRSINGELLEITEMQLQTIGIFFIH